MRFHEQGIGAKFSEHLCRAAEDMNPGPVACAVLSERPAAPTGFPVTMLKAQQGVFSVISRESFLLLIMGVGPVLENMYHK